MRKIVLAIIAVTYASAAYALPGDQIWMRTYGQAYVEHDGFSLVAVENEQYLLTGWKSDDLNMTDFCMLRINSNGDTLWMRTYPGDLYETAYDGKETSDGGYIMAGEIFPTLGRIDPLIVKVNQIGAVEWQQTYDGNYAEGIKSIFTTSDGGYVIGGWTQSFGAGLSDMYLFKINGSGDLEWQQAYGGSDDDSANEIVPLPDGGYALVGTTHSFGNGGGDAWLVRVDSVGDTLWTRTYGGDQYENAMSIDFTDDGGFAMAGVVVNSQQATSDIMVIRTDSLGSVLWSYTFNFEMGDQAYDIKQTSDDGFIIAGTTDAFGGDALLLKLDSDGQYEWSNTYGGYDRDVAYSVLETSESNYIFAGASASYVEGTACQFYIVGVEGGQMTDIGAEPVLPKNVELLGNYPNPFNAKTSITYALSVESPVTIEIFDILGRKMTAIDGGIQQPGRHSLIWDAAKESSGVFYYRLTALNYSAMGKMLLLK